jgi:hypothetical protein
MQESGTKALEGFICKEDFSLGLKSDISQAWIHGRRWTGDLRQA